MPQHELSAGQQRAISVLLATKTVADAAGQLGVSERTIYRWLADDSFATALRTAETELLAAAVRSLAQLQAKAIVTLEQSLAAPKHGDRVKAASTILNYAIQLRGAVVLEQRLASLEERLLGRNDDATSI